MTVESRRKFLVRAGLAGLALTSAGTITGGIRALELLSDYSNTEYLEKKTAQPHLKEHVEQSSVFAGVYPDDNNRGNDSKYHEFSLMGYFGEWKDWTAKGDIYTFRPGQTPMISIRPNDLGSHGAFRYEDLVEDSEHIRNQADRLPNNCLFRFEYEMNAPWFPHGSRAQPPQEFIDGWKFVTEIVKDVNPTIRTVWCPNVDFPLEEYYPGPEWVDYVALDGYNKHHPNPLHIRHQHPNPSFPQLFNNDIFTLQEMTAEDKKPIIIGEVGVDPANNSFAWITEAFYAAATYKNVVGVCLFAWNKGRGTLDSREANWGDILTDEFRQFLLENPYYITEPPENYIIPDFRI